MINNISSIQNEPIIVVRDVIRTFGNGDSAVTAVNKISCDVNQGEFLSITGRSGSGKTTLLNLMAGLDKPTSGSVKMNGLEVGELSESDLVELRRNSLGFVFQSFGLIPLLSAQENVELRLHISGISWRERRRKSLEALALVGLESRAQHRPHEMSGGEQQRVAIARALVNNPAVLFADEPTGELDSSTAINIGETLRKISNDSKVTVVVVTHDLTLARITDRRIHLEDGNVTDNY
ncbi:MAG: macrolide ABC transporter ATP-binding protein [Dehalococcoidia bacterium]|nr:macrolide ABC transporter ATP-binding protein [Dehalococcoidia bacterium]MQF98799.1 ABC transporter ATP-binding protein [SAR202 cluster bacterium]|tara:strand:- start:1175 stop:1882 length:708 start_codon:yes stop_codon:yes gene_type:complete